ncbi:NADH-quinone oxidoreductase subunit C [Streptomyces sp. NRRL S-37]|uniref:NADH-quinone oxidoreductase subunit C n=1 Tax=Streptomyces sp. NRRL S-37 TaxID=1463903 RepID=UPI0004C95A22|nr:NADH-quinone oxidoreductase subunit C [Streptomyces sp. NRRL S-37]
MTAAGWLPAGAEELFGTEATAEESYGVLTVDVPPASWITALETARDRVGCTFFDWLSAVDEPGTGFRVMAHVAALAPVRRLLLRTTVPHEAPTLPSAVDVYAGAAWHERETHEMFGVDFTGHPGLDHLLLPDGFEGHPLRKDFVLAARVAKAWPGAKEPGESEHGGPKRRQMLPPGVPDPNEWGPLKGQLPPAPARPARGTGRTAAGAARAAGDRPLRTRTAAEGSASQPAAPEAPAQPTTRPRRTRTAAEGSASQSAAGSSAQPRRTRTAAEGSVSQAAEAQPGPAVPTAAPARRARSASEGSASQRSGSPAAGGPRRARTASEGSASQRAASKAPEPSDEPTTTGDASAAPASTEDRRDRRPPAAPRSPDAPWHHAQPAFAQPEPEAEPEPETEPDAGPAREPRGNAAPDTGSEPEAGTGPDADADAAPEPRAETEGDSEPRAETEDDPETPTPEDPSGGPR